MNEEKPRIFLQNVGKKFDLNLARREGALYRFIDLFKKNNIKNEFWALKNINMRPEKGKILGVIGSNGSGKSTLLKIIADIYQPDEGEVETNGEIVYITGFGQGMMPKLTMKENIFIAGTLLGLNKQEICDKYAEIVEFSGLKEYENSKLYQFSTGMASRLSFSTTIFCIKHKNPDIILIDEALDAGADLNFTQKALKKIEELLASGANIVMVSHNLETIERYCGRVLWMEKGQIIKRGDPAQIIGEYIKSSI